jgi:hypothetical protein
MSDDNKTSTDNQPVVENKAPEVLPDWARKQISEANAEAAKYRTERNNIEAETKAKLTADFDTQFKTLSDEKSAITAERDSAASELTKLKVALAAGIPGETAAEFAALLQGKDNEELTAHAMKLKEMFGSPNKTPRAIDPSHGASGKGATSGADQFAALIQSKLTKN